MLQYHGIHEEKDKTEKSSRASGCKPPTGREHSLIPFGPPHIKIVDVLPTNLPAIESNELRLDNLFLLEDEAIGIIDYESDYSRENFVKYLNYAARIVKRYAVRKRFSWLKKLRIIVIYTTDPEGY